MTSTLLDGITAHRVTTPRLTANVLERASDGDATDTVVFVHGNVSSSLFFQPLMLELPPGVRALAIDLRGFGDSETLPVDASRGVRDFSDDVASVLDELGIVAAHLVGWSMGGGVVMQLMLDRPELLQTVTLEAPVSPYGFGGTGAGGKLLTPDAAGTGGGAANPDFVARIEARDTGDESPTSPRTVYRTAYVKNPDRVPHEEVWVESMLTTKTGAANYPGDSVASESWPGFGAGTSGVLNTMAPTHFDTTGIVDLAAKPPVLWIHGADDAIVSDTSFFDLNYLGQLGAVPGWPGEEIAPAQPMKQQTREVLGRYRDAGGRVTELALDDCGHAPHLDRPEEFRAALLAHIAG
jgi:pimeloyl-ACP methyl ester carboxylesterase